ncbi:MAG: hypothetical protein SGI92_25655, partial [Bryobacteraceae bacterium]|nr:hypothetical protein [Bryobacteraceae bacterium]
MTRHANQTTVEVTSTHSMAALIAKALEKVSGLLHQIKTKAVAEQLTLTAKWSRFQALHSSISSAEPYWAALPGSPQLPVNCRF